MPPSRIIHSDRISNSLRDSLDHVTKRTGMAASLVGLECVPIEEPEFFDNFLPSDLFLLRVLMSPPIGTDEEALTRFFWRMEASNLIRGFESVFPRSQFVNPPRTAFLAGSKPLQLRLAAQAGLTVPDTLITTSVAAAKKFALSQQEQGCRCIIKPIDTPIAPNPKNPADAILLYTRELDPASLDPGDGQAGFGSPVIIQRMVEKSFELRVIVFGRRAVVIAIDSQRFPESKTDWRWREGEPSIYSYGEIDLATLQGLHRYLDLMELDTGVFDLAVDTSGVTFFLECNPHGQWLGADELLGGRGSLEYAEYLLDRLSG